MNVIEQQTFRERYEELFGEWDKLEMSFSNAADTYVPELAEEGDEDAQWEAVENTWGALISTIGDMEYQLGCLRDEIKRGYPDV